MRMFMFAAAAATSLLTGCCGSAFRVCDGPCGGGESCDPCCWYPGKCLIEKMACTSGCGKYYWSDWHSEPPACCDPCNCCGHAGQYFDGNPCGCGGNCGHCAAGNSGGWGGYSSGGGGGCGCGGGNVAGAMQPMPEGDVIYEGNVRPKSSTARMTPTPITPAAPPRATATRPKSPQTYAPRTRYNASNNTARQPIQRRIRPASHETTSNSRWDEAEQIEPQANAAPIGKPCTTCRR